MSSVMDIVPPRLPEDLIIEILLRLPAKSLLRFTSACHKWHKIIKNPGFERDHFHRGGEFTSRLAYWYGGPCNQEPDFEKECDFEIHEELGSMFGDEIALERYEVPDLNDIHSMHGPCYGIICVAHTNNTLALWNPTTKISRLLPTCPLVTSNCTEIGFGLDPVTDDLKIVLFDSELDQLHYAIYNSRNGAWDLSESNTISYPDSFTMSPYAILNGVCYWMKVDKIQKGSLLAFDMSSDLFQDVELPEILQQCWRTSSLEIFDDNLVLLTEDFECENFGIWLMKEQGCWTNHSVVKLDFHSIYSGWKMNQIFIRNCQRGMIFYDIDSGNTRVIKLGRMKGSRKLFTFPYQYKESLVSV